MFVSLGLSSNGKYLALAFESRIKVLLFLYIIVPFCSILIDIVLSILYNQYKNARDQVGAREFACHLNCLAKMNYRFN